MTLGAADVDALAARGVRAANIGANPTRRPAGHPGGGRRGRDTVAPIQQTFGLDDAAAALAAFSAGTRGKVVLLT
jgi:hypothetical protein